MRGYKNFEGSPHPGDLRHRIEIGYTKNTVNANGYPEPTDVVLCRVWASATDAGNQHYRSADAMNTEAVSVDAMNTEVVSLDVMSSEGAVTDRYDLSIGTICK